MYLSLDGVIQERTNHKIRILILIIFLVKTLLQAYILLYNNDLALTFIKIL